MLNILDKLWGEKFRNMKNDTMGTFMKTKKRSGIKAARGATCLGLAIAVLLTLAVPYRALAIQGDSGYDSGISSGEDQSASTSSKTSSKIVYEYQELCFLSGTPVIFDGTVTITKKLKTDSKTNVQTLTTTYKYAMTNPNAAADNLSRTVIFATTITPKGNGQKTESTKLTTATETIKVNGVQYFIPNKNDYVLSKSDLIDNKPAVNYYNGTLRTKKTYHIGKTNSTDTIIVESSGNYFGYDEYWSSAEAQIITQKISRRNPAKKIGDIGTVNIEVSNTTKKEMEYYENIPQESSIAGGYVQTEKNENILKYTAKLSELDKNKVPTTKINTYTDSLKLESFPTQTSLISPDLKQINGHPSEEAISLMFGLEAFTDSVGFDPEEYMSRGDFINALVKIAKEVPLDPVFITKSRTTTSRQKNVTVTPLFTDVSVNHALFDSINGAATRGIIYGNGKSKFNPDKLITMADAVTMIINSMGLNGLAPNPAAVTSFKDNDSIPSFARPSMYVAEKIGLIQEDAKGYIHPKDKITKAKAAEMMKAYIEYMSSGIRSEYMDKIMSY